MWQGFLLKLFNKDLLEEVQNIKSLRNVGCVILEGLQQLINWSQTILFSYKQYFVISRKRITFTMDRDPFFNDPFAHMEQQMRNMQRMMNQAFGGSSMFGSGTGMGGMGMFDNDPFFQQPQQLLGPYQQQMPRQRHVNPPQLEEIDNDAEGDQYVRANGEPIVEEPDDEGYQNQQQQNNYQQRRSGGGFQDQRLGSRLNNNLSAMDNLIANSRNMGPGSQFQSYSYSSFQSSGPGGTSYRETQQTNVGPGGVLESRRSVRDGRSGKEQYEVTRGLQGRGRTVQRTRFQDGREEAVDTLHNLDPQQATTFEQEWQQHADSSLAGNRLGGRHSRRNFRQIGDGSEQGYGRRI
eukprot:TRINITY_DN4162_c0_g1_i3.p1 TRINITY_DN4162_c0_g1~~TRINITY_DN4162_c0_g1_i3.p1  ORF type:complete len:350 (-),score=42.83 TRINITY_DN4162_c0_g1_i3:382-1431(-)